MINNKITELWDNPALSEEQRVVRLKIFFNEAKRTLAVLRSLNEGGASDEEFPLARALNDYDSIGLFRALLAEKASPLARSQRSTVQEKIRIGNQKEYAQAIVEQQYLDLLIPTAEQAMLGEDLEVIISKFDALASGDLGNTTAMIVALEGFLASKKAEVSNLEKAVNSWKSGKQKDLSAAGQAEATSSQAVSSQLLAGDQNDFKLGTGTLAGVFLGGLSLGVGAMFIFGGFKGGVGLEKALDVVQ